ncbi:hypothetical protein C0J52_23261 [Blattella germanica]|nr:hypothetical protein C0J52_23261 [Blattella germanica]
MPRFLELNFPGYSQQGSGEPSTKTTCVDSTDGRQNGDIFLSAKTDGPDDPIMANIRPISDGTDIVDIRTNLNIGFLLYSLNINHILVRI